MTNFVIRRTKFVRMTAEPMRIVDMAIDKQFTGIWRLSRNSRLVRNLLCPGVR